MGHRIDIALTERQLCQSRSRAKLLITEGKVKLNGKVCTKPSVLTEDTDILEVEDLPFVGRGGLKLEGALTQFAVSPAGLVCLDIGASTGGFTDCLLKQGAKLVYAVDVGHGQLAENLRKNSKVRNMEKTDIRTVQPSDLEQLPDLCSIDVSFISLKLVLPCAYMLLKPSGTCIALVKPQFEAGKKALNKQGIVKSEKIRKQVLSDILEFAGTLGFSILGQCESPIQGGDGNTEYLLYLQKAGTNSC